MDPIITNLRTHASLIFQAGVSAADPFHAVQNCLTHTQQGVEIVVDPQNPQQKRLGQWRAIHVLAFGKAALAMLQAVQQQIPQQFLVPPCIAVTNYENERPVANCTVIGASHPLPDQAGLKGAKLIAERASQAKAGELVMVLVSGGGSALLPYPASGISLEQKMATTQLLLGCGASINEVNCVRKHLSQLKGGGLTKLCAPADVHAFILSDVIGNDLSSIASGPTVADTTTFQDAIVILQNYAIWDQVPVAVRELFERGQQGLVEDTPKRDHPCFNKVTNTLVGSNPISIVALAQNARQLGYPTRIYSEQLTGEARVVAEQWVIHAKELLQKKIITETTAFVAGGETTVKLTGNGRGGRNQEMALAFALAAEKHQLRGQWVFLSGGTDGRDGPTDAAGGIVDTETIKRIDHPDQFLNNNDSYHALQQSNDLLMTGATGTNVADLQVLLFQPQVR